MLSEDIRINSKERLKEFLNIEKTFYQVSKIQMIFPIGEIAILRRHQVLLRKTEYYLNTNRRFRYFISKFSLRRLQMKYAMYIPLNCCNKGLRIMHLGPVLMNNKVTVGENCKFHMNSAVVAGGTNDSVPSIGNNVVVGYGAVILGDVLIADRIAVGANAVVNKSFTEAGVTIAGIPAKVISQHGSEKWGNNRKTK